MMSQMQCALLSSKNHPANDFIDYPNHQNNDLKPNKIDRHYTNDPSSKYQIVFSHKIIKCISKSNMMRICLKNVRVSMSKFLSEFPTKISLIGIIRLITRSQYLTAVSSWNKKSVNGLFHTKPNFFTVEKCTELSSLKRSKF